MKRIAFPTEDGKTISRHFGRAPLFVVATLQDSGAVSFEQRSKEFHGDPSQPEPEHKEHDHVPHDHAPHEQAPHDHAGMFGPIADCQVLIAGGMGQPAYDRALAHGLQVVMTGESDIQAALQAYQAGKLASDLRRVHPHGSGPGVGS